MTSKITAEVKTKIKAAIKKHELFENDMHIVLGLSGGPDSVCLFDVLCELAEEQGLNIYPVHINHKFRPGAAEADQEYVEELCRQRGWQCESFVCDCAQIAEAEGLTSEEAGRKVRYEAFVKTAQKAACENGVSAEKVVIAVAQNANDQAETILFRMLRGSGIDGLAGIAYKRYEKGYAVVRPLLDVSRDEIEKYCEEKNLSPRRDHTNEESIYTRNKIRLELLPLLAEAFNPNIVETVNRLGKNAACDKDFLYAEARTAYERIRCPRKSANAEPAALQTEVYAAELSELHKAIRIRIYHIILEELGMRENITQGQLEAIERVLFSESPSAVCELADGYRVSAMYDRLAFYNVHTGAAADKSKYRLRRLSARELAELQAAADTESEKLFGAFWLPSREAEDVCVRKRRDGDVLAVRIRNAEGKSEIHTKKLQDFFVDVKLPKLQRDEVELLAYGSRILWVLPSEHYSDSRLRKKGRFSAAFSLPKELLAGTTESPESETEALSEDKTILVLEIL